MHSAIAFVSQNFPDSIRSSAMVLEIAFMVLEQDPNLGLLSPAHAETTISNFGSATISNFAVLKNQRGRVNEN